MRVGIDYRPALVNREGIGRYARELVRGCVELGFDANLGLFGYTLARDRGSRARSSGLAGIARRARAPALPVALDPGLLARLGKGVDDLVGGCDVYHHTQTEPAAGAARGRGRDDLRLHLHARTRATCRARPRRA